MRRKFGAGYNRSIIPVAGIRILVQSESLVFKVLGKFLAERGIATVVAEREVRVGERWYVSCFQLGQMI